MAGWKISCQWLAERESHQCNAKAEWQRIHKNLSSLLPSANNQINFSLALVMLTQIRSKIGCQHCGSREWHCFKISCQWLAELESCQCNAKGNKCDKNLWCNWSVCWMCKNLLKRAFTIGYFAWAKALRKKVWNPLLVWWGGYSV